MKNQLDWKTFRQRRQSARFASANETLLYKSRKLAGEEREITKKLLEHIKEVDIRRLWIELGYASLQEWPAKDLKFDDATASRSNKENGFHRTEKRRDRPNRKTLGEKGRRKTCRDFSSGSRPA
jgi:hypothetical protein